MNINWTQLVTRQMKEAAAATALLTAMKADLAARNATASLQIDRIQDRIETLGYGIDSGEATAEDEAEQSNLTITVKTWKAYKFALGKVTGQSTWPAAPVWPVEPVAPVIAADPEAIAAEAM